MTRLRIHGLRKVMILMTMFMRGMTGLCSFWTCRKLVEGPEEAEAAEVEEDVAAEEVGELALVSGVVARHKVGLESQAIVFAAVPRHMGTAIVFDMGIIMPHGVRRVKRNFPTSPCIIRRSFAVMMITVDGFLQDPEPPGLSRSLVSRETSLQAQSSLGGRETHKPWGPGAARCLGNLQRRC